MHFNRIAARALAGMLMALSACTPFSNGAMAAKASAMSFKPPQGMVDNWDAFADIRVPGRIKKLEPWTLYERIAPCTVDKTFCAMIRDKIEVATLEIARAPDREVSWIVTLPKAQKLKVGDVVLVTLPHTSKDIANAVMDSEGKVQAPQCEWRKVEEGGEFEGLVCEAWRYSKLKYVNPGKSKP